MIDLIKSIIYTLLSGMAIACAISAYNSDLYFRCGLNIALAIQFIIGAIIYTYF